MGEVAIGRLNAGTRFPDRRATPRFAFDADLEMIDPVEQKQISGRVTVLSHKGCFARTQGPMAHGTVVRIRIHREGKVFETWARATPSHPETETGVVLIFLDTPPEQAQILATWIEALAGK